MEVLWALGWGAVALVAYLAGAPDWVPLVALIIGGLVVPVVILDND